MSDKIIFGRSCSLVEYFESKVRLKEINQDLVPENKNLSYRFQSYFEKLSKSKLIGWKIAATSKEGQEHIGVNAPIAGRLIKERLASNNQVLSLNNNQMKVVEAEFAFEVSEDFIPRDRKYETSEVFKNIECCYPAIEIPDSRIVNFEKAGDDLLIIDNACAGQYILGESSKIEIDLIDFINFKVKCFKNNELVSVGLGKNVLGNPILALTWLINELISNNLKVLKGQIVMTGTCIKPLEVCPGDSILMDFNKIGKVQCTIR